MFFQKLRHWWYDGLLFWETSKLMVVRGANSRNPPFFWRRQEFVWLARQLFGGRAERLALRRMLLRGVVRVALETQTRVLAPFSLALLPGPARYKNLRFSATFLLPVDYSRPIEAVIASLPDCLFANDITAAMFPVASSGRAVVLARLLTWVGPASRETILAACRPLRLRPMIPLELIFLLLRQRAACPGGGLYALGSSWIDGFGRERLLYANVLPNGVSLFLAWPEIWPGEERISFPLVSEN